MQLRDDNSTVSLATFGRTTLDVEVIAVTSI